MAQLPLVTEAEAVTPPPQMGTPTAVYPLGMGPGTASTGLFPSLGSLLKMDDAPLAGSHNASPAFADPATKSGREQHRVLLKDNTGRGSQLLAYIDSKSNWVYPTGFMPHVHDPDVVLATPMSSGGATNSLGEMAAPFQGTLPTAAQTLVPGVTACHLASVTDHIVHVPVEQVALKDSQNQTLSAVNQRLRADKHILGLNAELLGRDAEIVTLRAKLEAAEVAAAAALMPYEKRVLPRELFHPDLFEKVTRPLPYESAPLPNLGAGPGPLMQAKVQDRQFIFEQAEVLRASTGGELIIKEHAAATSDEVKVLLAKVASLPPADQLAFSDNLHGASYAAKVAKPSPMQEDGRMDKEEMAEMERALKLSEEEATAAELKKLLLRPGCEQAYSASPDQRE